MTVTSSAQPDAPAEPGELGAARDHRAPAPRDHPPLRRAALPNPAIVRPAGLPRAARPGNVPTPEHHHLPGWVRRAHGQAQPILADLLGILEGSRREALAGRVDELVAIISSGKFSQAWAYPRVIADGQALVQAQRREQGESARARHAVETSRRRVSEQLREHGAALPPDTAGKLTRALRSAPDRGAVAAVAGEVERAVEGVRTHEERRRDREIDRTRARILRGLPRSGSPEPATETWQDTLRRFAEQQAAEGS